MKWQENKGQIKKTGMPEKMQMTRKNKGAMKIRKSQDSRSERKEGTSKLGKEN